MADKQHVKPRGRRATQDFYEIREQLLSSGELFEDQDFPPASSSITQEYEWKRPHEISAQPALFTDGSSRFDVVQGELGDCWLVAALANLTLNVALLAQVVPSDQGFGHDYAGIFHFRFWQYGKWLDVVIDDKLPTSGGRLAFVHSSDVNEFWSALLEKAYAKLQGSYEELLGGLTSEAMVDFTGGVTEVYKLKNAPDHLFRIMAKAYQRLSFMGCSIAPDPTETEAHTEDGLIKGHAYSITCVKTVRLAHTSACLLRLRNPWGNEEEWTGAWSDQSSEWDQIPENAKLAMDLTFAHDGEFWMCYEDFRTRFSNLEICNLNPEQLTADETGSSRIKWEMSMFKGEWVKGVTAGGCRNSVEDFALNPQYRVTLADPDEGEARCTVIVALMQKNKTRRSTKQLLTIGFVLYQLCDPDSLPVPLDRAYFEYNSSVEPSVRFTNLREVSHRFKLPPGTYCIVPSTFHSQEEGKFVLRVFSENKNHMEENDEKVNLGDIDERVSSAPIPAGVQEEDQLEAMFRETAGDGLEVDWKGLKEVLEKVMSKDDPGFEHRFSSEVCRSMLALMDEDRSCTLGLEEFRALWGEVRNGKEVFKLYMRAEESGAQWLHALTLRRALNSAGYRLNSHTLNILAHRYSTNEGLVSFDDFVMCTVRLKTMIDIFREKDPGFTNKAVFTMDDWIEKTMYS